MSKLLAILLACACLGGCIKTFAEEDAEMADQKCRALGARPGTPEYIQCYTSVEQTAAMNRAAAAQAMQANAANQAAAQRMLSGRGW
jgi:hypothetical protein